VISAATGRTTLDYATEVLFRPIGMAPEWWTDAAGHALTYCCLDAPTREYARFGLLFARGGEWNGKQVVSKQWVEQATQPLDGAPFYALQWWTNADGVLAPSVPSEMFAARGLFDQDIYIVPSLDLVVVRNGTYHRSGDGSTVRTGGNVHSTLPPNEWDVESFLGPIVASIGSSARSASQPASPASATAFEAAHAAERAAGLR
jgi:CubicO group peptidase (beta-lactamase class C family)